MMATFHIVMLTAGLVTMVTGQPAAPCCMPGQYEGKLIESGSQGRWGSQPFMYNTVYDFAYDAVGERLYVKYAPGNPFAKDVVITDYTQVPAVQQVLYSNGTCVQEQLNQAMRLQCETGNRLAYYQLGLDVRSQFWAFSQYEDIAAFSQSIYVWNYECSLLWSVFSTDGQGVARVFGSWTEHFIEVTNGIKDNSIFDPPPACAGEEMLQRDDAEELIALRSHFGIVSLD